MGVAVSKTNQSDRPGVGSYTDQGDTHPGTRTTETADPSTESGLSIVLPKPLGEDVEMMELLCAGEDDDIDDAEWKGIYQRLKTDKQVDLHRMSAHEKNVPETASGSARRHSRGPVLTSSVVERNTRVTSANFCPHAPTMEPTGSKQRQRDFSPGPEFQFTVEQDDTDGHNGPVCPVVSEYRPQSAAFSEEIEDELLSELGLSRSRSSSVISHYQADSNPTTAPSDTTIAAAPTDRNTLSTTDAIYRTRTSSFGSSSERYRRPSSSYDPFEGMDIPRSRVSSIGSGSVFSVNEVEDRLYKDYAMEIRRSMLNYGYFDKFPSPFVIGDAQRTYRRLNLPKPVDEEGHVLPHPIRVPIGSVLCSKSFAEVDQHALRAPADLVQCSLSEVVSYLFVMPLGDAFLRLRGFFVWLAARQLEKRSSKRWRHRVDVEFGPTLDCIDTSDGVCRIFRRMCRYGRIKSKLIRGIVRDDTFCPGEDLDKYRNVWVAVLVEDSWWLVDPFLRPDDIADIFRHSTNQASPEDKLTDVSFSDLTFFEDPEMFIFSHFPDEEHWQLLARCVLREELPELAVLRPGFFRLKTRLLSHHQSVFVVQEEELVISLGFPDNSLRQFCCRLRFCGSKGLENDTLVLRNKRISLNRFTFVETLLNTSKMNVRIKFPKVGTYILDIFGTDDNFRADKDVLVTYRIVYEGSAVSQPFPTNDRGEWGPGMDSSLVGVTPLSHKQGEIFAFSALIQVRFNDHKGIQFKHDLIKDDKPVENLRESMQFLRDAGQVIFIVNLVEPGYYTLKIHARSDTSKPFSNICNYLVKKIDTPDINGSKTNINDKMYNYKLSSNTTVNGKQQKRPLAANDSGQMKITLDGASVSQLIVDMKIQDKQEINFSEHTRHWREGQEIFVEVNFPRKGLYILKMLGRSVDTNKFKALYEEMIQADVPSEKWSPFPKPLIDWSYNFKLISPLNFHIEAKTSQTFKAYIPGAQDVAILGTNGWSHLTNDNGIWSENIVSGLKNTTCKLMARFEKGSEKFSELLLIKMMTEEQLDSMDDRQEDSRNSAKADKKKASTKTETVSS